MLQHRGQDSAGMVTYDGDRFKERKDNGLVKDVFDKSAMKYLDGHIGGTAALPDGGRIERHRGAAVLCESTVGNLFDSAGNLTNTEHLRDHELNNRHLRTGRRFGGLLNAFAEDLSKEIVANPDKDSDKQLFDAVTVTMGKVRGRTPSSHSSTVRVCLPFAIRTVFVRSWGNAGTRTANDEWCVASEDAAFGPLGFQIVRDVNPGEGSS